MAVARRKAAPGRPVDGGTRSVFSPSACRTSCRSSICSSGYWLPALLVREPNTGFERRLLDVDRTLFGPHGLERFEQRAPRALIEYLELAYLLCYAVVPAGFVVSAARRIPC